MEVCLCVCVQGGDAFSMRRKITMPLHVSFDSRAQIHMPRFTLGTTLLTVCIRARGIQILWFFVIILYSLMDAGMVWLAILRMRANWSACEVYGAYWIISNMREIYGAFWILLNPICVKSTAHIGYLLNGGNKWWHANQCMHNIMYMNDLSSILLVIYVLLIMHTRRYFVFVFYITHSFS
jgi:hypothetical protein